MDFFFIVELYQAVGTFLSKAAQTTFVQNLVVYGIMWFIIKKAVAQHFYRIETSLERIAKGVEKHEIRIEALELKQVKKPRKRRKICR